MNCAFCSIPVFPGDIYDDESVGPIVINGYPEYLCHECATKLLDKVAEFIPHSLNRIWGEVKDTYGKGE